LCKPILGQDNLLSHSLKGIHHWYIPFRETRRLPNLRWALPIADRYTPFRRSYVN